MTWFVVRTAPGAQMPQREYVVEKPSEINPDWAGFGRKGYRIVPSLNPNVSAVERALSRNGFTCYMPAERQVIRSRRKTQMWTMRRFAILPGYVFVSDPHDWRLLQETEGVAGIVGVNGAPYSLSVTDFMMFRTKEALSLTAAEEQIAKFNRQMSSQALKTAQKVLSKAKRQFGTGTRVDVLYGRAIGRQATIIGWEDDGRLKAIADGLEAIGTISMRIDDIRKVA